MGRRAYPGCDASESWHDRLDARVFVLEKPDWRKSIRVLARDLEDARACADRLLPPWRVPLEDGPFGRDIGKRVNGTSDVMPAADQRRLAQILARAAREA